jgi:electron transfer flavoprotein alpha subunit
VDLAEQTVTKTQFSGKTIATFKLRGARQVIGMRPNLISPQAAPTACDCELIPWTPDATSGPLEVSAVTPGVAGKVALSEAEIIVSGGRAMGNGENFAILQACAQALGGAAGAAVGAAVGASRVAVDSGWVPHTLQVGQTGTTVCPKLYIACGISGAVQHFAGMKTAEVIVAINQDPEAPLMRGCDYGIVGDLFEIVPLLTRALGKRSE